MRWQMSYPTSRARIRSAMKVFDLELFGRCKTHFKLLTLTLPAVSTCPAWIINFLQVESVEEPLAPAITKMLCDKAVMKNSDGQQINIISLKTQSIDSSHSNGAIEAGACLKLRAERTKPGRMRSPQAQKDDPKIQYKMTVNCEREEHGSHLDATHRTKGH